jgi:hypothetical protein
MAALCKDEGTERVVVAADRMVTYPGFIEFEHAVPKIGNACPYALAMAAGDTLTGTRLAHDVAEDMKGTSPRVLEIAERLADQYEDMRKDRIEHMIMSPRALDLETFYAKHAELNANLVMVVDQAMMNLDLGVELLLAGVDQTGAHLYTVRNPGKPELQHDVIGHAQIGSGAIHTLQSMIGFGHKPEAEFRETVFRVYASKRRAEVAPGVGVDTDMAVVSADGVQWLTEKQLNQLQDLYDNYRQTSNNALENELSSLELDNENGGDNGAEP